MKRLINGGFAKEENIIACCHLAAHYGFLTKKLIKAHDCLTKKCTFFERLKPEYWEALEKTKQKKRTNRQKKKRVEAATSDRERFIRKTLQANGHIYVTSIREEGHLITISYIYEMRVDLSSEIENLRNRLKKSIRLRARVGSDEAIEQLIRKPRRETGKVTDLCKAPGVGPKAKKRLEVLGVFCLEDLFGRNGAVLYALDCARSRERVNRRYLAAYRSAANYANAMVPSGSDSWK